MEDAREQPRRYLKPPMGSAEHAVLPRTPGSGQRFMQGMSPPFETTTASLRQGMVRRTSTGTARYRRGRRVEAGRRYWYRREGLPAAGRRWANHGRRHRSAPKCRAACGCTDGHAAESAALEHRAVVGQYRRQLAGAMSSTGSTGDLPPGTGDAALPDVGGVRRDMEACTSLFAMLVRQANNHAKVRGCRSVAEAWYYDLAAGLRRQEGALAQARPLRVGLHESFQSPIVTSDETITVVQVGSRSRRLEVASVGEPGRAGGERPGGHCSNWQRTAPASLESSVRARRSWWLSFRPDLSAFVRARLGFVQEPLMSLPARYLEGRPPMP